MFNKWLESLWWKRRRSDLFPFLYCRYFKLHHARDVWDCELLSLIRFTSCIGDVSDCRCKRRQMFAECTCLTMSLWIQMKVWSFSPLFCQSYWEMFQIALRFRKGWQSLWTQGEKGEVSDTLNLGCKTGDSGSEVYKQATKNQTTKKETRMAIRQFTFLGRLDSFTSNKWRLWWHYPCIFIRQWRW